MSNSGQPRDDPMGIALATGSYVLWGVAPLYWHLLPDVPALQITAWRIVMTTLLLFAVIAARKQLLAMRRIFTTPDLIRRLAITSALIAVNWVIYIYSVVSHQLVESSLGYFMLPLVSIALGVVLLGEHLSRVRLAALGLMGLSVSAQAIAAGHVPWIALVLAVSFGFYGYLRKTIAVDAASGLLTEAGLLFPLAVLALAWFGAHGSLAWSAAAPGRDALLIGAGPVTAIPLAMFAAGARRIRLSTLGFLQYLSPLISLVIAVALYREPFGTLDMAAFGSIWAALCLIASERQLSRLRLWAIAGR